jgi:hypothetical protein
MPDLFRGDSVPLPDSRPEGFVIPDWLKNHQPQDVIPIVQKVLERIKTDLSMIAH